MIDFVDLNYNQAAEIIKFALDSGIRYFDTAPWYGFGRSERVVGDQLRNSNFIISNVKINNDQNKENSNEIFLVKNIQNLRSYIRKIID